MTQELGRIIIDGRGTEKIVTAPPEGPISQRVLKERAELNPQELAQELGVGVEVIKATVNDLQGKGYGFAKVGESFVRTKTGEGNNIVDHRHLHDIHLNFGVVSDTHLGSKKERLDELRAVYEVFAAEGVTEVYHLGDLTDGWKVYRGQEFEVKFLGQAEQEEHTVKNYPREEGITTHFITGNHDLRMYEKGGVDPGVPISGRREDMEYLGQATARVIFPEGVEAQLLHPSGGVAYALSYKSQRYINNLNPEDVPQMMMFGHYHTTFYMHYRNVHFIQAGCFKGAGIWEKRIGLNPTVAGWHITGKIEGGEVLRFRPELIKPRV